MNTDTLLTDEQYFNHKRAYELLGDRLDEVFSYVEPREANSICYGHKTHSLLLSICTEFEAVCKFDLVRRGYINPKREKNYWNISDFATLNENSGFDFITSINRNHYLATYEVKFQHWNSVLKPLEKFSDLVWDEKNKTLTKSTPEFYGAYNNVKHNRSENFFEANLKNLILSYAALTVLLHRIGFNFFCEIGSISAEASRHITGRFGTFTASVNREIRLQF